jgi:DNA-binding transcriptional LysR family regulator
MLPDFNRLRVFFHVHRTRSVSRAATELSVTQSAVSQSLAKLEAELDAQLFVRRHRTLVPTPAADTLFTAVAPFIESLQHSLDDIHRARHELWGVLRIGAPVELGARRLPAVLAAFRRAHPGVGVQLQLGHPSQLVPMVQDGGLELAFTDVFDAGASAWSGLDVVPVLDEALVLVATCATEHAHLKGSRAFRDVAACPFVTYHPRAPAVTQWFRHHFSKTPPRLEVALAAESVQTVLGAIEEGMGMGVVPAHAAAPGIDDGRLVAITTRRRAMTHRISLVRLLDKVPSQLEREFVRFVAAVHWES